MKIRDQFGFASGIGGTCITMVTSSSLLAALSDSVALGSPSPMLIAATISSFAVLLLSAGLAIKSVAWKNDAVLPRPRI